MNYAIAKKKHKEQWLRGKHKDLPHCYEFPYNFLYENEDFVTIDVRIECCRLQEVEQERVDKYKQLIQEGIDLGPPWVICSKKFKDGTNQLLWDNKFYVLDGNHRISAYKQLGYKSIAVIVPRQGYEEYMRKNK